MVNERISIPYFDVVIVGGGSAGAASAYYLSHFDQQKLLKILLIEKKNLNGEYEQYHHKCGEGVSKRFLQLISPIHVKEEEIVTKVNKFREFWIGEPEHVSKTKEYILNRPLFLKNIIAAAEEHGVALRFDDVIKVENKGSEAMITCKTGFMANAKLVIGADGPNSRIRDTFSFGEPKIFTVMQYLIPAFENSNADEILIWYDEKYQGGYKYVIPYGNEQRKIGFIHLTDTYEGPILELQAKQIAMGGLKSYLKDHVVLIGDAAGQANLLTGGGILPAFIAARVLSRMIVNAAKKAGNEQRPKAILEAAKKFEIWWKHSPYDSRRYTSAFEQFARFSNKDLAKFSVPFRSKNSLRRFYALLKNLSYWRLYSMFFDAAKHS
ncbi:MAG TPA: NAD(P)/FAD-dependent oxidoreductase [Candidatus Lokiarchaeia archaeon]|nr:NAD(P)/FAD-dependent oxidoreductase [Candidatus Lokiarchaeia archaeon]